jgi:hypothetical protein
MWPRTFLTSVACCCRTGRCRFSRHHAYTRCMARASRARRVLHVTAQLPERVRRQYQTPGAHRSGRERLRSSGSSCPAVACQHHPVGKECVFHACRSRVSSHARPTFQAMSVQDFTACRSKTTRAEGGCRKVLLASMVVDAERRRAPRRESRICSRCRRRACFRFLLSASDLTGAV